MKKLIFVCIVLSSCSEPQDILPLKKVGCVCRDGKVVEWKQNILIETSNTTQYPCQSNGGIVKYLYK